MNKLPEFRPVTRAEMRRMWAESRAEDVRRLTLEVERYRRVMREIDQLYRTIHESWRNEVGGELVALHRLKILMTDERDRAEL
jgi:hypothetical protein